MNDPDRGELTGISIHFGSELGEDAEPKRPRSTRRCAQNRKPITEEPTDSEEEEEVVEEEEAEEEEVEEANEEDAEEEYDSDDFHADHADEDEVSHTTCVAYMESYCSFIYTLCLTQR